MMENFSFQLLLGTISNIDKHSLPHLSNRTSNVSQEQHNVVPFAPNPVRFMLLPISTQQEKTNPNRIEVCLHLCQLGLGSHAFESGGIGTRGGEAVGKLTSTYREVGVNLKELL